MFIEDQHSYKICFSFPHSFLCVNYVNLRRNRETTVEFMSEEVESVTAPWSLLLDTFLCLLLGFFIHLLRSSAIFSLVSYGLHM